MDKLREWREGKGYSIPQAATEAGTTRETWWRWENGVRQVGLSSLPKISELTGIPRGELRPDIFGGAQ
jgi:transcriptional regulator with XRE-family HTH domain